jgi:hypothetical protein
MYENIGSFGCLINKVIIRLPIQKHLAPFGYQKQPPIITFNPPPVVLEMYICTALNADFISINKYKSTIINHDQV